MAQIQSLSTEAIIALVNAGTWPTNFPVVSGVLGASGTQVAVDVSLASAVAISLKNEGTVSTAAGVVAFEGSLNSTDGVDGDWFSVSGVRTDTSGTIETGRAVSSLAAGAVQAYGWEVSVNSLKWFRIRTTTTFTGSSSPRFTLARGAYASEPSVSVSPHAITGTVTVQTVSGTNFAVVSAGATIHASAVKAAAGNLLELTAFNGTGVTVYVKIWDKASAPAPAADSASLRAVIPVAAGASVNIEFGNLGKRLSAGIGLAITTGAAATDVAFPAAGVMVSATYL